MEAYAYAEPFPRADQLRARTVTAPPGAAAEARGADPSMIDQLLGHLADLVVDRLMERTGADTDRGKQWFDAQGAADYLGMHRDTLRKLAAQRAIPAHQDRPRCKLFFRRDELDEWRRASNPASQAAQLPAV
jgi:excisionase family DNA binding protein